MKKTVRRLPPCPSYDVEGMESWLTDLAREDGLFLVQDGIFAGVAEFEVGEPRHDVKYRLEAAPKSTSFLADDGGNPDPEAVELNREFSWEYVGRRGEFYIYRTDDPTARELNTDPEVQAMAISAVKKRQLFKLWIPLYWLLVFPVAFLHHPSNILLTSIKHGTWYLLWALALALWGITDGIIEVVHLNRLVKKLKAGGTLEQKKPWRNRTFPYQIKNYLLAVLFAAWVIVGLNRWSADVQCQHQPADCQDTPPFATMADFGTGGYSPTFSDWDEAREWSDWLAPYNLEWSEHAEVRIREGEYRITGGLEVEYHEMAAPFLARWVAWELTPRRSTGPYYQVLELPPLDVDYAAGFSNIFPTVVLQKGNQVLMASFYQTSEDQLELEEWVTVLADSLNT